MGGKPKFLSIWLQVGLILLLRTVTTIWIRLCDLQFDMHFPKSHYSKTRNSAPYSSYLTSHSNPGHSPCQQLCHVDKHRILRLAVVILTQLTWRLVLSDSLLWKSPVQSFGEEREFCVEDCLHVRLCG